MNGHILTLLALAILLPACSAAVCFLVRNSTVRNLVVIATTVVLFVVAGDFVQQLISAGGVIRISEHDLPHSLGEIIKYLDVLLLLFIAYNGFKLKNPLIICLTVLQLVPVVYLEFFHGVKEPSTLFLIDYLSLIMIMLISIVGPVITVFAIGYMEEHEHHLHLTTSRQPRFFMLLFVFLGAMNALVMTNNLSWMYFFWEITTLCSFMLIGHDQNEISIENSTRALWMNLTGGVAFIAAIVLIYFAKGTLSVEDIAKAPLAGEFVGLVPIGLGLLCFAGFTKSAQFPFQSWLLGAMVAPTPVSALLHSSTMVKAGVYLVVRMAPAYSGTILGKMVAIVGGFTFLAGSAIAISQSNAKRVLAYSTIANLGLIVCCAGIGSNIAIGAAILLMVFHGVSKGLLFLCVGTVEQGIGSRNIEDMQGLMKRMPYTTTIMVIGAISMLLPPFGVLITKWMAIEAAVNLPIVLALLVMGSALTVVFWAKWIGIILTMSYKVKYTVEKMAFSMRFALGFLFIGVFATCVGITPLYNIFIDGQMKLMNLSDSQIVANASGVWLRSTSGNDTGGMFVLALFGIIFFLIFAMKYFLLNTRSEDVKPPYLCGENIDYDIRGLEFTGPGDKPVTTTVTNYYLIGAFGEEKLTTLVNLAAGALILLMLGVVIR